jgi:Tfp pilus assembly protein PilE
MILVIVIIGIIAGIALPSYYNAREKILRNEAFAMLKMLQAAARSYYIDVGQRVKSTPGYSAAIHFAQSLKVTLPPWGESNWDYVLCSNDCFDASSVRTQPYALYRWHLHINDQGDPQPQWCP